MLDLEYLKFLVGSLNFIFNSKLTPIDHFPDKEINEVSEKLLSKYKTHFKSKSNIILNQVWILTVKIKFKRLLTWKRTTF